MSQSGDPPGRSAPHGLAASFDRVRQNLQNILPSGSSVESPANSESGSEGQTPTIVRKARKSHQSVRPAVAANACVTNACATIDQQNVEKRAKSSPSPNANSQLKKPKIEEPDGFASPQEMALIANSALSDNLPIVDCDPAMKMNGGISVERSEIQESFVKGAITHNSSVEDREEMLDEPMAIDTPRNGYVHRPTAGLQVPLCLCRVNCDVRIEENAPNVCQAVSQIDDQVRPCANCLGEGSDEEGGRDLVRPHVRVPFFAACQSHNGFLKRHICCPMCGVFCLKGSFLVCREGRTGHFFHAECVGMNNTCPHCGGTRFSLAQVDNFVEKNALNVEPARFVQRAVLSTNHRRRPPSPVDEVNPDAVEYYLTSANRKISSNLLGSADNQVKIKELLLKAQNKQLPDVTGFNMKSAIDQGKLDVLLGLLDVGTDPNTRLDYEGDSWAPLHLAVHKEDLLAAYLLLQGGADPNLMTTSDSHTALIMACDRGKPVFAHLLLKFDADPMVKCMYRETDGLTALHISAMNGYVPVVHILLKSRKVELNVQDDGGWTALSWATEHGKAESVHLLLTWGARSLIKDMEGNVCLHWASYSGSLEIATELLQLDKGVEVALKEANVFGDTPLHVAAREKHWHIIEYFLTLKPDLSIGNVKGETPMQLIMANAPEATKLLAMTLKTARDNQHRHIAERILSTDISCGHERLPICVVNGIDRMPFPTNFHYVKEQVETSSIHRINRSIESMVCCDCKDDCSSPECKCVMALNRFNACVYDQDRTINDLFDKSICDSIFECNQACKCWARKCRNRVAQKGISKRLQVYKDVGKGWCVTSLEHIKRGTFICEYTGEVLTAKEGDERPDDSYLFEMDNPTDPQMGEAAQSHVLDAKNYGNVARFINHGCDSNLQSIKLFWDHQDTRFPHICLYAERDIQPHEELTFDYGEKFWIVKYTEFTCMCGAENCKFSADKIESFVHEYRQRHALTGMNDSDGLINENVGGY